MSLGPVGHCDRGPISVCFCELTDLAMDGQVDVIRYWLNEHHDLLGTVASLTKLNEK